MVYHFGVTPPKSIQIFRMQKNIIRIMLGHRRRDSCKILFRELKILPLASQNILSLMLFVAKKKNSNEFIVNSEIHGINARQQNNLHQPLANLRKYQLRNKGL
jgi:hypothetical protein